MFVMLLLLNGVDEPRGGRARCAGAGHPGQLRSQRRRDRLRQRGIARVHRARGGADGLARRPRSPTADRRCRAVLFAFFVFLSGLAVNAFMLFLDPVRDRDRQGQQHSVHPSLVADNYPIGVRGRISANNVGSRPAGSASPARCWSVRIATLRRRSRGLALGVVRARGARLDRACVAAFFMPRATPRASSRRTTSSARVIDDEHPAPISMEAAFERFKRIRTIRTRARRVLPPRLRTVQPGFDPGVALPRRARSTSTASCERGVVLSLSGIIALPLLRRSPPAISIAPTARPGQGPPRSSAC